MARILVAEDDPLVSSFIEKGLRAAGHTATVAADGEEATRLALDGGFDLIVLDMALPKREGVEVLQDVRAAGIGIPVIVLTGRPEMRDVVAALDVGVLDFMTKPFRFDELLARIRERLPWGDAEPVPTRQARGDGDGNGRAESAGGSDAGFESHAAPRGETGWRGS
jgi:two-component system copper resistance phosphate regulon response regulator CusR